MSIIFGRLSFKIWAKYDIIRDALWPLGALATSLQNRCTCIGNSEGHRRGSCATFKTYVHVFAVLDFISFTLTSFEMKV